MPSIISRSVVIAVSLVALTACDTARQAQSGLGSVFSGDSYLRKGDRCYAERSEMAGQETFFAEELIATTVGGAFAGGVAAALTGGDIKTGVVVGAAFGLAGGYLDQLMRNGLSADQITSRAVNDVSAENRKIETLVASFDRLATCRKQEGRGIQARYDAKEIDRPTAEAEMAGVRTRYQEDVTKFREIAAKISKRSANYAAIYNDIAADNGGRELVVRDYTRGTPSAKVARRPAQKVAGTEAGSLAVSDAGKHDVDRLQRECLTNVQRRDDALDRIETAQEDADEMALDLG